MKVTLPTEFDVFASLQCLLVVIAGLIKLCYDDMKAVRLGTHLGMHEVNAKLWLPGFANVATRTLKVCMGQIAPEYYDIRISPTTLKMAGFKAKRGTGRLAHELLLQLPLYSMVSAMADINLHFSGCDLFVFTFPSQDSGDEHCRLFYKYLKRDDVVPASIAEGAQLVKNRVVNYMSSTSRDLRDRRALAAAADVQPGLAIEYLPTGGASTNSEVMSASALGVMG